METDRNLLFGAFCVKFGVITLDQLVSVLWDWNGSQSERNVSLAELLESRKLVTSVQRAQVERVLSERLSEFNGDASKALSEVIDEASLEKLSSIVGKEFKELQLTMTLINPVDSSSFSSGAATFSSSEWNSGSTQERYRLAEETGHGGMGQVWIARDTDLNRRVALKTIKPKFASQGDVVARFLREAQITGQLEHPNVIRVYELSRSSVDQRPYFSMQLIRDKRTLKTAIREYHDARKAGTANPVEFGALLSAFVAICQALGYAHSRGVLHRDLKPQNVMLGRYGEAIVIDWGLAKFEVEAEQSVSVSQVNVTESEQVEATQSGQVLGTPAYLPPEQASGKLNLVDARSDIYGLGAILFEILVGRPPHQQRKDQGFTEFLRAIVEQPSPIARQIETSVPAALDAICSKAIAKEQDARYQKATELADDVRRWLAGEPVTAYAEPWRDRFVRWLRKHRAAAMATAVAVLVVAVTASIAAVFIHHARGREEIAKQAAVERLAEAERAVDVSLTGVNEVLKFYPSAQTVRQRLLEQAVTDYARFASIQSDDMALQLEAARASLRLGNVRLLLDQFEQAICDLDSTDQRLATIEHRLPQATFERGVCAAQRGEAFARSGRNSDAKSAFERALEFFQRSAAALPADTFRWEDIADARIGLARVLEQMGDSDGARTQLKQALKIVERASTSSGSRDSRRIAAKAEHSLAQLEMAVGQLDAAGSALGRALQLYAALLSQEKNFPVWLDGQALCRVTLANLQRRQGHDREALDTYLKAVGDFDDLARAIPGVPHYEHVRVVARTDTALLRLSLGQAPAARELLDSAIVRIVQLADGDEPKADLIETAALTHAAYGAALRDLGQSDTAEESLLQSRELFEKLPRDRLTPDVRRQAAVVVSQLARLNIAAGRRDEGLELFRQADEELRLLIAENDGDVASKNGLAASCRHWADALQASNQRDEAAKRYRQALDLWRDLPDEVELHLGQLWLLLTGSDETLRDPQLAVSIAERLLLRAPDNARLLALLSLAKAQLTETDAAERFAKQSLRQLSDANSTAEFVLALVEHQRGHKEQATPAFELATRTMNQHHPASWSAQRLQDILAMQLGRP